MTVQKAIFLVGLLALSGGLTHAEDKPTQADVIKKLATEIGDAVIAGDYEKMADRTYTPVIELAGGRKDFSKTMDTLMKQMKKEGYELKKLKIGEPSEILTNAKEFFVIVPTTLDISSPSGTLRSKSYLIGVSEDNGRNWKFVDGAGLKDKARIKKLFPNLPEKLKLPEAEEPELLRKDK